MDNNMESLTARRWVERHQPEIDLMRWSAAPAKRRTHAEQEARLSWRIARFVFIVIFFALAIEGWIYTLISSEVWGVTGLCFLLAVTAAMVSPEAPDWFIRLYKRAG